MRSCDEMDILIQLKLDDLLDPSQERLLEEHLRECRSCRERYEQLRVLKDALGSMEEPAPAGLHGSIMRYVEKNGAGETPEAPAAPKSKRRTLRRFLTAAAAVAACCALVLVGKQMFPRMGSANETVFYAANDTTGGNVEMSAPAGSAGQAADESTFDSTTKNQGPDSALDGIEESKQTDTDGGDEKIAIDLPPMDESERWSFGVENEKESISDARRIRVTGSRGAPGRNGRERGDGLHPHRELGRRPLAGAAGKRRLFLGGHRGEPRRGRHRPPLHLDGSLKKNREKRPFGAVFFVLQASFSQNGTG